MNESTTPTSSGKRLPRYEGRRRAEDYVAPLPPRLLDAMDAAKVLEAAKHRELAQHFEKARERAVKLAAEFEKTKADDEKRATAALASGKERPAPRSEKLEIELAERREDVSLLADLLRSSADELLAASIPFAAAALKAAERDSEAAIERVRELLEAVRAALEETDRLAGENGWLASLVRTGVVYPWTDATRARALPSVRQALGRAIEGLEADLATREANREERERHDAVETKNLPPGARVWRDGRDFTVTESGELEEVEVER